MLMMLKSQLTTLHSDATTAADAVSRHRLVDVVRVPSDARCCASMPHCLSVCLSVHVRVREVETQLTAALCHDIARLWASSTNRKGDRTERCGLVAELSKEEAV